MQREINHAGDVVWRALKVLGMASAIMLGLWVVMSGTGERLFFSVGNDTTVEVTTTHGAISSAP